MSPEEKRKILLEPISHLVFTDRFVEQSKLMKFESLQDIINTKGKRLLKRKGFSAKWLVELLGFLDRRDMLDLLSD